MKREKVSERAVGIILTCRDEELSTLRGKDIAEVMGIHPVYLSQRFKIDQKISLSQFINREKIYRAIFILDRDHEISVETLARRLGFPGVENFVNKFESILPIKPEKYQELAKMKHDASTKDKVHGTPGTERRGTNFQNPQGRMPTLPRDAP